MPSDLTGVRERVEAMATLWEARARFVGMTNTLDAEAADLRALLAALDAAEAERARLRQWAPNVRFIAQEKYPRLHELADLLAATPTETPDV